MYKKVLTLLMTILFLLVLNVTVVLAQDSTTQVQEKQTQHRQHFVDEDGDGFNDNAPDHDGDGIPNGLDEDFKGHGKERHREYIDLDGDGINDNRFGPKDKGPRPQMGEKSRDRGQTDKGQSIQSEERKGQKGGKGKGKKGPS
ncbi:MAG: hypothetical protein GF313_11650 [Caldithrix sp.]|nr:hypothetical protein [Caldithrix sp.]